MLTEEYLKDNLITAYFIDNDRRNIEMLTRSEDQKSVFPTILPFDENNEQWKFLKKFISLEQLHELTYEKNKKEREEYEKSVLRIAQREGLVMESNKVDSKFFNLLVKTVFEENSEDKEELFTLKIALFELDKIKNSKNTELKTKLRKAQTIYDTLSVAFELTK
jgi:hypothetical protein